MSILCPCDLVSTLHVVLLLVSCPFYVPVILCQHYIVCYCLYYALFIALLSCVIIACITPCSFPCGLVSSLRVVLLLVLCPVYFPMVLCQHNLLHYCLYYQNVCLICFSVVLCHLYLLCYGLYNAILIIDIKLLPALCIAISQWSCQLY